MGTGRPLSRADALAVGARRDLGVPRRVLRRRYAVHPNGMNNAVLYGLEAVVRGWRLAARASRRAKSARARKRLSGPQTERPAHGRREPAPPPRRRPLERRRRRNGRRSIDRHGRASALARRGLRPAAPGSWSGRSNWRKAPTRPEDWSRSRSPDLAAQAKTRRAEMLSSIQLAKPWGVLPSSCPIASVSLLLGQCGSMALDAA